MKKLGLLVLRKNGIAHLATVLKRVAVIDSLEVKCLLGIKWKEEELESNIREFYSHITEQYVVDLLVRLQGSVMLAIVLVDSKPDPYKHSCSKCGKRTGAERLDNMNVNRIKDDMRVQYGNIIHSADTEAHALDELVKLGVDKTTLTKILSSDETFVGTADSGDRLVEQLNTIDRGVMTWSPQD